MGSVTMKMFSHSQSIPQLWRREAHQDRRTAVLHAVPLCYVNAEIGRYGPKQGIHVTVNIKKPKVNKHIAGNKIKIKNEIKNWIWTWDFGLSGQGYGLTYQLSSYPDIHNRWTPILAPICRDWNWPDSQIFQNWSVLGNTLRGYFPGSSQKLKWWTPWQLNIAERGKCSKIDRPRGDPEKSKNSWFADFRRVLDCAGEINF